MSLKRCPGCGVELAASLVDAIVNPSREESCPKAPVAAEAPARTEAPRLSRLGTFMLVGALMREGSK